MEPAEFMTKKLKEAVKTIVESCDTDKTMPESVKQNLADEKIAEINTAIKQAREEGKAEGLKQASEQQATVVKEAEESAFRRGVDAGVDQTKDAVDTQGQEYYEFIVELIREIDTLQKLMVKIARAESYLEGYEKGKAEAAGSAQQSTDGQEDDGAAEYPDADQADENGEGADTVSDEDAQARQAAESTIEKKFKNGSKLLVESVSKWIDSHLKEYLTESVITDRGELEHLRMVVESIRNSVVVGDGRVTEYITTVDRSRRQELNESRKENDHLKKKNLILESTNRRLAAKNLLIEKTESLPAYERRQMRDAFKGVEDAQVISESFDEKFAEMKRQTVRENNRAVSRKPVMAMVNESIDKANPAKDNTDQPQMVNESEEHRTVNSVVRLAAQSFTRYPHKR